MDYKAIKMIERNGKQIYLFLRKDSESIEDIEDVAIFQVMPFKEEKESKDEP